jgi:2-methylcitrate dehydratase PrpD
VTTIAEDLAEWLVATDASDLPTPVVEDAKWRLVDQVGVGIAGARDERAAIVARIAEHRGGRPEATTIVFGTKLPAPTAGWVNGTAGHIPDFDDMNGRAAVHISSVAVPAALAAAEALELGGERCLAAMVVGAEIALRIASGAPPHQFHRRGLHGTGVAGPFAAAAIGAKLLRLSAAQTTNAIGMAGSRSSGLMQTLIDGSSVKQLHPGWGIEGGLTCALLAAEGYTGPAEVVEGKFGFFNALLFGDEEQFRFAEITQDLGDRWLLPETTYKPWPNGVWNHASMAGADAIVRREGLGYDDIGRIDVHVPPICLPIVCEPREAKLNPRSEYHLKFSLPYSVAMLLVNGSVSTEDYTEATLGDKRIRDLAQLVFCHADESMLPNHFPARVEILATDGRRFVEDVPAQPGDPENPITPEGHRAKFRENARPTLGEEQAEELLAALEDSWNVDKVSSVLALTVPRATSP